jgi:signal transduction histidine kinase
MQGDLRAALTQRTHLTALGEAVSKVNHDLRNILATAQLVTDRLGDVRDPTVRQVVPRLMQSIDRAIKLCSQSLNFGSAEEPAPHPVALNLRELADDAVAYAGLPGDGGISWRNDVPAELTINADRDQMFRVLMNLARNAIQAMPGGGAMTLTAECGPDGVVMDFGDNGPGLPEKARAHLFEAFTGAARAGGTGLGLAIAKELVVAHGGELSLVSSDGDGTRFRIDLPDGSP